MNYIIITDVHNMKNPYLKIEADNRRMMFMQETFLPETKTQKFKDWSCFGMNSIDIQYPSNIIMQVTNNIITPITFEALWMYGH